MRKTILILDDEQDIAKMIGEYLKDDYEILLPSNVLDALKMCEVFKIDLAIFDYNMPLIKGNQFYETAKKMNSSIKFICISGQYPSIDCVLVSKPISLPRFRETIKKILFDE